ncbi:hypothetical protein PINS_up010426 [Pythium insidiosum]|nr:hypothetical protein PINS_up010426 [Pythium insidiosum]
MKPKPPVAPALASYHRSEPLRNSQTPPDASASQDVVRRPKTSSERGRAFRERRRRLEQELHQRVGRLRREIELLQCRKDFQVHRQLQQRCGPDGSIAKLTAEYFALFQHGYNGGLVGTTPSVASSGLSSTELTEQTRAQRQAGFLLSIMAADAITGDLIGPEASLRQWHAFSTAFARYRLDVEQITSCGDRWHVAVHVKSVLRVRISHKTLRLLFPGAERQDALVRRFVGADVVIPVATNLLFDRSGLITSELVNLGILEGLVQSEFSVREISELMQYSIITPSSTVHEERYSANDRGIDRDSATVA